MARKSRKRLNENEIESLHPITERAERIRTAAYARISNSLILKRSLM